MKDVVIIDTNIWVQHTRLLSSPLGSALASNIKRCGFALAIPEIVNKEVNKHILKDGQSALDKIKGAYKTIEMLIGERDDYRLPERDKFTTIFPKRLAELDIECLSLPTSLENYVGATERVMNELPPNGPKNQQYKDSLIWEAVLELGKIANVHLITRDKAFFKEKTPKKGIDESLLKTHSSQYTINVYSDEKDFLRVNNDIVPQFDKELIETKLRESLYEHVLELVETKGAELDEALKSDIELFLTRRPTFIAVDFNLRYRMKNVVPMNQASPIEAIRSVQGSCLWNIDKNRVEDVSVSRHITTDNDGNEIAGYGLHAIGTVSLTSGRSSVEHNLKVPVNDLAPNGGNSKLSID
ncbi:MAG: PIN domain-containing protein [Kangiellaceae bacterium]|nr:PIN domain-containing protein [Kangiellaceae bacterium]